MVEPNSSKFRVITTNFLVSKYLGNLRYLIPKLSMHNVFHLVTLIV